MEKNFKKFRVFAIILISILISIIAFGGIFVKKENLWSNIIPGFKFGKEFAGIRQLKYIVDSSENEKEVYVDSEGNIHGEVKEDTSAKVTLEENNEEKSNEEQIDNEIPYNKETRTIKVNEDSALNIENFEKSKKIVQKRLESKKDYDYNIRLDTITGELIVEVPDNDRVQSIENLVSAVGKIEIVDYQNGVLLIDNSEVKSAKVSGINNSGYRAYLQLDFNKEGTEKLKEISNKYQKTTAEDGTENTKYVSVKVDGQAILTTYFGEELSDGIIQIPLGESTNDYKEYLNVLEAAEELALIINEDTMPVVYTLESDNFIQSEFSENILNIKKIIFSISILLISLYIVVKYKLNGLKISILNIGYIGLLFLAIKYTNVFVTINSVIAFLVMIGINYVFSIKLLKNINKNESIKNVILSTMKQMYLSIIPVIVLAFVFTFMSSVAINSIGMMFFWGIIVHLIYSFGFVLFAL